MHRKVRAVLIASTAAVLVTACSGAKPTPKNAAVNCVAPAPTTRDAPVTDVRCFDTFRGAIAYATGNAVELVDADVSRYVARQELAVANNLGSVVISIDYKDANYSGASFTWTAGSGCGAYSASSMPSGWNDVISSVVTYSGCAETLYQNTNFGGSTYAIHVNSAVANLGSFNDQTSSERWCTTYPCS